jgi:hypothetical protein
MTAKIKSLKKGKAPKKPRQNGSVKAWDNYEKKLKEYNAKGAAIEKEKTRRERISNMKK